jgi:hypothetical protein
MAQTTTADLIMQQLLLGTLIQSLCAPVVRGNSLLGLAIAPVIFRT